MTTRRPAGVLLCPPDHFDVVDVKNPCMEGRAGSVDRDLAHRQWDALRAAFAGAGATVEVVEAEPGREDMVFAANPTLTGLDSNGRRVCMLGRMRHESRRAEVAAYAAWFAERGYEIVDPLPEGILFEGGGDAIHHPNKPLIWAAYGPRTDFEAHEHIARAFDRSVVSLPLVDERFYHLDTCLCALDATTALWYPAAFATLAQNALRGAFETLIEVDEEEATGAMACNAAAFDSRTVVIDQRAVRTIVALEEAGFRTVAVDTGEFLKSGGSVYCLKQFVW